jgi:integrase
MPVVKLNQGFIETSLTCPEGKRRTEYCDGKSRDAVPGLYIEVRNTSPCQGTFYLRHKDPNGKTCHQKLGRTTDIDLATAREKARTLRAQIALGADPSADKKASRAVLTYSSFFENEYLPYVKPRKRSWRKDESMYRLRLKKEFGNLRLYQIRRQHVATFHNALKEQGLSGATADHHLKLLRYSLNIAVRFELLNSNPAASVPCFNEFNQVDNRLSDEELKQLFSVLKTAGTPISKIALMAAATGCRLSELTSLSSENCDLKNRVLYIEKENSKSKKRRTVPLNDMAMQIIQGLAKREGAEYVFENPKTKTRYYSVYKGWDQLRRKADLPHCRFHDLRHLAASRLASAGESIYVISKLLGHANVVTSERYSAVADHAIRNASDNLSRLLTSDLDELPRQE